MNKKEMAKRVEQDSFGISLRLNVDIKLNKGYIEPRFYIIPQDKELMCASLIFWYATRLLWLAQSTEVYEVLELFDRYIELSKSMELVLNPMSNKIVKVDSIGTIDDFIFTLDYEGYAFGGMFERDMPLVTLYSFFTMYKYFTDYLLPKRENIDFYEDVDEILRVFMDTNFANASPMIMRELCLKSAMNVAYQYVG